MNKVFNQIHQIHNRHTRDTGSKYVVFQKNNTHSHLDGTQMTAPFHYMGIGDGYTRQYSIQYLCIVN